MGEAPVHPVTQMVIKDKLAEVEILCMSCKICNTDNLKEKAETSSQVDDNPHYPAAGTSSQKEAKPRSGVYIGETSRSLHERAFEHLKEAEGFGSKSHILKHWMTSHPELNSLPPCHLQ